VAAVGGPSLPPMKLQRLQDVRVSSADAVFRQSSLLFGLFLGLLIAIMAGASIAAAMARDSSTRWLFGFVAAGFSLFGLLIFSLFRKTLGPANWLMRITPAGDVTVKFRSYANAHFPADDLVAFTLSPREIRWIRASSDRTNVATGRGIRQEHRRYLDLAVDNAIAGQIDEQLKQERRREAPQTGRFIKSRTKVHDYPVSVADGHVIRIEWRGPSTWIRPGLQDAIDLLSAHVPIESRVDEGIRDLSSATPDDARDKILALARSGDELGAIKLARKVYGSSLTEARGMVHELMNEPAGGSQTRVGRT
jgi:hypothetical protein